MMDLMYTIPSDETIESCVVTRETIEGKGAPKLSRRESLPVRTRDQKKTLRAVEETA